MQKLYTEQKNILLDNAEKKEKAELLKKTDINASHAAYQAIFLTSPHKLKEFPKKKLYSSS